MADLQITAPLNSHAFPVAEYDRDWFDMLCRSLRNIASRGLRDASNTRPVFRFRQVRGRLGHKEVPERTVGLWGMFLVDKVGVTAAAAPLKKRNSNSRLQG